ncbi:MAG: methyl-accepting chemotaxis protein [Treponema sp.]|jgi:methyl-accepting chemotaxis protein|nr:methyl-accepting chemotaxis protein [Treponema sp.]
MKLKIRLSIIVTVLLIVVVVTVSAILIVQATTMQLKTVATSQERLAESIAMDLQRRYEVYLQTARSLTTMMSTYEHHVRENRRTRFLQNMEAFLEANPHFIAIYAIWKPNVLDDMDAEFAGQPGSSLTGQFIPQYTRESGKVELRSYDKYQEESANMIAQELIGTPEVRTINGQAGYSFRFRVPIFNDQKNLVGIVGVTANAAPTQTVVQNIIDQHADIDALAIYTHIGFIIGHFDPKRIGKNVAEAETGLYGKLLPQVLSALQLGQHVNIISYSPGLKTNLRMALVPLIGGGLTNTPWLVMVGTAESAILKDVNAMVLFAIIVVVISIIIAAVITFIVVSRITKPIVDMSLTLKDIAEGEGDLTKTITVSSNDEIGDLAKYFNQTLEKIKDLVITIKNQSAALFNIGTELASNMTETAAAINEITATIQSIKGRVINQSASVIETNTTMEQITVNIDKLNDHIEHQSANVSQSSSAIEEMLASIQSVAKTMVKNAENVKELADASGVGRTGLQEVAADIQEIAKESEGLLEINAVMQNIASQTNLLSMNAAIEAAHAGDVGKGFAVVADEIRKLAENSGEQSKTISTVLKKIKDSIDKITKSTDAVLNKFEAIDGGVKTVSEKQRYVNSSLEELNIGSKQILDTLGQLNGITVKVKSGSAEMLAGSKEVIQESKNLEMVTQEISNGISEMATGAEQINIAVNRVNTISGDNRDNIDILVKEIARFKVE